MIRNNRLVACLLLALVLTACNTVRGIGQDVKAAGEAVEDAAD
jgi:predicted small secreted protein